MNPNTLEWCFGNSLGVMGHCKISTRECIYLIREQDIRFDPSNYVDDCIVNVGGKMGNEIATLGGGCFWCLEAIYEKLRGVRDVGSGYSGGHVENPSYEAVCSGTTGHAEVVRIVFDSEMISYKELLQVFFTIHDPTTLNRQGADVGTQYRSVIFYHSPEQKNIAEQTIQELNRTDLWKNPIVTEVLPFDDFYPAEDYHQEYYRRNPNQGYCRVIIDPKVAKFRKEFFDKLKSDT
jgi:peptide-methionine (S)-S-oxide reductase